MNILLHDFKRNFIKHPVVKDNYIEKLLNDMYSSFAGSCVSADIYFNLFMEAKLQNMYCEKYF
jgi:hypothetical protein